MPEFEFSFQKVGLQPVNGLVVKLVVQQRVSGRTGDAVTGGEGGLVLTPDRGIGNAAVDQRHRRTAVAEDRHDCLNARAALGELGADRVPEAVRAHRRVPVGVDQARGGARSAERLVEQRFR